MTIIGLGSPCRSAARASSGGWTDGSRLACSGAPATAQQPCPPSTGARLILVILPPCRSETSDFAAVRAGATMPLVGPRRSVHLAGSLGEVGGLGGHQADD